MTLVYVLPNAPRTKLVAKSISSSDTKSQPNTSSKIATTTTQPTGQGSTSHASNSTIAKSPTQSAGSSSSSTTNSAPTSQPTTSQQPPETLAQQYPDTYPSKWAGVPLDTVIDTWGMYNRESVSYTAWKVNEAFGNMPTWGFDGYCDISTPTPNGPPSVRSYPDGDAICWLQNAQNAGIAMGSSPKVHSVGITTVGVYASTGFSVWVEAVNGNQVTVSSYNSDDTGNYKVETVSTSTFSTYIYFQ